MSDFQMFLDWLSSLSLPGIGYVCTFLSALFGCVVMVVQLKKLKYTKTQSKELNLKYRSPGYQNAKSFVKDSQSFDTVIKTFKLNKFTGELVESDSLDLQQLINSNRESILQDVLSRLEPAPGVLEQTLDVRDDMQDKLDMLRSFDDSRLSLCEEYGLDPSTSYDNIVSYLQTESERLDGRISELKKVGVVNAQSEKTEQTSES